MVALHRYKVVANTTVLQSQYMINGDENEFIEGVTWLIPSIRA